MTTKNALLCLPAFLLALLFSDAAPRHQAPAQETAGKPALATKPWILAGRGVVKVSNGSGFAVSTDEIITCRHVVVGEEKIAIILEDGMQLQAKVVGDDGGDLSLLKVAGGKLNPLALAAAPPSIGDDVWIWGHPCGKGWTVHRGMMSAATLRVVWLQNAIKVTVLQLNCDLNPGNSGGPVVDVKGEVVGVACAVQDGCDGAHARGIGYAIPASKVAEFLAKVRKAK